MLVNGEILTMIDTLELECIEFDKEITNTLMQAHMLSNALNMYDYVRYNGINRTFVRLHDKRLSAFLNRPIDINKVPVTGSPNDKLSLLFLTAMEDDNSSENNKGLFSRIYDFIVRTIQRIRDFFKRVFRKIVAKCFFNKDLIEKAIKDLDIKNMDGIDVRVMDYKQVAKTYNKYKIAMSKMSYVLVTILDKIQKPDTVELFKDDNEIKEFEKQIKEYRNEAYAADNADTVRKNNEDILRDLGHLKNPVTATIRTDIRSILYMIGYVQSGAKELATSITKITDIIDKKKDTVKEMDEANIHSGEDVVKELNLGHQRFRRTYKTMIPLMKICSECTAFVNEAMQWNGAVTKNCLADIANIIKAVKHPETTYFSQSTSDNIQRL